MTLNICRESIIITVLLKEMKFLANHINYFFSFQFLFPNRYLSKIIYVTIFIFLIFLVLENAEGHKLLEISSNDNTNFEYSLTIPNHTISWAIYQTMDSDKSNARFYKFENDRINNSLYAQISIPQIEKYKNFSPSLVILEPLSNINSNYTIMIDNYLNHSNTNTNSLPFEIPNNYKVLVKEDYQESKPSVTFYEPFTQTNYWEKQEIRIKLQNLGTYYIVVYNQNNDGETDGKFTLAVGNVEDFSLLDFFIQISYSWIKIKLFFNDYLSIFFVIFIFISFALILFIIFKKVPRKK